MKRDDAWCVGDPMIEWTGRADGIEDAQFSFSDLERLIGKDGSQEQKPSLHSSPDCLCRHGG